MENAVLDFLIALAGDPDKLEKFAQSPDDVLNETDLSGPQKTALKSREQSLIFAALYGEALPDPATRLHGAPATTAVVAAHHAHNVLHIHVHEGPPESGKPKYK